MVDFGDKKKKYISHLILLDILPNRAIGFKVSYIFHFLQNKKQNKNKTTK